MMSLKVTQKATARNARTDWKEGNNQQLTGAQRNNKNNTGEIPEKYTPQHYIYAQRLTAERST